MAIFGTASNRSYWIPKIDKNIKRDFEIDRDLKLMGWEGSGCIEQVREAVFYCEIGEER
jgi:DNA mismatch endonuclease (patch repair protein)